MRRLFALMLCIFLLSGCMHQPVESDNISIDAREENDTSTNKVHSLLLYYGDDQAESFLSKEMKIEEITPHTVADLLITEGIIPEEACVNEFSNHDGKLHIDFNEVFRNHLCSMGTAGERMLIGSVANTFLDAFDGKTVMITVNGDVLESGHVIYDAPIEFME